MAHAIDLLKEAIRAEELGMHWLAAKKAGQAADLLESARLADRADKHDQDRFEIPNFLRRQAE